MSKKTDNSLLKNVAGIAVILLVFVFILRLALAPLYQDMDRMEDMQEREMSSESNGGSGGGDGGESDGGGSDETINIGLGGLGGLFNWALGWQLGVDLDGIAGLITGGGGRMFGMVGRIGGTETIGMTTTGRGMETTTDGIATIVATTGTIPAGMIATMVAKIGGIAAKTTEGAGTMKEVAGMVAAGTGVIMAEAVMAEATGRAFRCKRGAWHPRLTSRVYNCQGDAHSTIW